MCWFCHEEVPLSREHLISNPIATCFGIDRDDQLLADIPEEITAVTDIDPNRVQPLSKQQVRAACEPCNNGWMSKLETDAAEAFAEFLRGEPLSHDHARTIRGWGLSRYVVWNHRDGDARSMKARIETQTLRLVVDPMASKALRDRDYRRAFEGTTVGLAKAEGFGLVGFGNAKTQPSQMSAMAGSLALQLGGVQIWTVVGALPPKMFSLPHGVKAVQPGLQLSEIGERSGDHRSLDPALAVVHFLG